MILEEKLKKRDLLVNNSLEDKSSGNTKVPENKIDESK